MFIFTWKYGSIAFKASWTRSLDYGLPGSPVNGLYMKAPKPLMKQSSHPVSNYMYLNHSLSRFLCKVLEKILFNILTTFPTLKLESYERKKERENERKKERTKERKNWPFRMIERSVEYKAFGLMC